MPVREAVAETTDGISRRIARSAARDVASMPGEAIPFWGTAVIVGVTAAELLDLCNTLRDLHALKVAFSPDAEFGADETAVCAIKVPTREELWRSTKAAPGDAWSAAREFVPTLEEIQAWELTDLDYGGIWGAAKSGTASYTGWITSETGRVSSETLDATVQFGTDVTNQAGSKASDGIQSLRNWLNSD